MLGQGGQAVCIMSDNKPVAAGWLIRGPFYVDEIRRSFDAGPDADYYLGCFVAEAARGHGLQRALIRARLKLSQDAGSLRCIGIAIVMRFVDHYEGEFLEIALEMVPIAAKLLNPNPQ